MYLDMARQASQIGSLSEQFLTVKMKKVIFPLDSNNRLVVTAACMQTICKMRLCCLKNLHWFTLKLTWLRNAVA